MGELVVSHLNLSLLMETSAQEVIVLNSASFALPIVILLQFHLVFLKKLLYLTLTVSHLVFLQRHLCWD